MLILLCIAALCALTIVAGTLYAVALRAVPGTRADSGARGAPYAPADTAHGDGTGARTEEAAFVDTGRRRITLKTEEGGSQPVLVVKASIPYAKNDTAAREELVKNIPEIRGAIDGYFSEFTLAELQTEDEGDIKREILKRIQQILVLNKPQEIFFEEFIFFE